MARGWARVIAALTIAYAPSGFAQSTITLPDTDVTVSVTEGILTLTPDAYNAPGSIGYYARNQRGGKQDVCLIELSSANVALESTEPVARMYFENKKLLPLSVASTGNRFKVFAGKNRYIDVRYVFYQKEGGPTQTIIKSCNAGSNEIFAVTFFPDRPFTKNSAAAPVKLAPPSFPQSVRYSIDDFARILYRPMPKQLSFDDPAFYGFGGFSQGHKVVSRFSTVYVAEAGGYIVGSVFSDLIDCDNRRSMTYGLGTVNDESVDLIDGLLSDMSYKEKLTLKPLANEPTSFSDLDPVFVKILTDVCSNTFTPGTVDMKKYL